MGKGERRHRNTCYSRLVLAKPGEGQHELADQPTYCLVGDVWNKDKASRRKFEEKVEVTKQVVFIKVCEMCVIFFSFSSHTFMKNGTKLYVMM